MCWDACAEEKYGVVLLLQEEVGVVIDDGGGNRTNIVFVVFCLICSA